jgi:3-oxoacyl-[acyl-carrier-protein] synthase-3
MERGYPLVPVELGPISGVGILGGGAAFPPLELTNLEVLQRLRAALWRGRTPDDDELRFVAESLEKTMGVQRRAWSHLPGEPLDHAREGTVLSLAVAAARQALEQARCTAGELGLVLCATSTPHRMSGTLSAAVAQQLGASCAAMDTRTGCSGGLFALATGALYTAAGAGPVLIVGADTFSKVIPSGSKLAALSLGDGAGALVLGRRENASLDAVFLKTDGALGGLITTDGALPPTHAEIDRGGYVLSGAPDELTAVVPSKYAEAIGAVLARSRLKPADLALFAPHQTSRSLIDKLSAQLRGPRTFVNVERHANIGAAGWIVALVESMGSLRPGDKVLTAAVGGGMSWGAAVMTW